MPTSVFDLVYSADVLEHIEFEDIENTLNTVMDLTTCKHIHIIDLSPAKKKLPDGRNAHVSLLNKEEWINIFCKKNNVHQAEEVFYEDKFIKYRNRLHIICQKK